MEQQIAVVAILLPKLDKSQLAYLNFKEEQALLQSIIAKNGVRTFWLAPSCLINGNYFYKMHCVKIIELAEIIICV